VPAGPVLPPGPEVGREPAPVGPPTGFEQGTNHIGWAEDSAILAGDTVHFEYDRSEVRSEEKPKVAAVADYLKSNPANAVKIEGHCDERGTEEYNRALGERRALALRETLIGLGVDAGRVDTVSFGKDRPVDPGHDAAAWEKNRRGVFIVLSPPK
jgi:peptidoglycan-associated lipoprotein